MKPRSLLLVAIIIMGLALALVWGAPALLKEGGIVIEIGLSSEGDDLDIQTITIEDGSATQDAPLWGTHTMDIEIWETSPIAGGMWHKDILIRSWTFSVASKGSLDGQNIRVVLAHDVLDIDMLGTNYGLQMMYDDRPVAMAIFRVHPNYTVEVIES